KYVSAPHIVAATPTNTTEKRSISPTRPAGAAASDFIVGAAIVRLLWPPGQKSGARQVRSEGLLSSRLYGRPRSGRYAFTGSCAVGRSRALPPIRELHPCPEDHDQIIRSSVKERAERREVAVADRENPQVGHPLLGLNHAGGLRRSPCVKC